MRAAVSVAGVETGAMEGGGWNPESCPRYTAKSICYIDLALLPIPISKAWRRKHTDFMQRFYATAVKGLK